ncbi:MAG: transglutaminase protein [Glaciihabitans sp.]|nr:transglutaminase protein [Glaciihabitans sp.]
MTTFSAVRSGAAVPTSTGVADLRMSGLLLIALGIAMAGLHSILADLSWWFIGFSVAFAVFAAAAVARRYLRARWMGTIAAVVVAIAVITLYFSDGTAFLGVIPTTSTLSHFSSLMAESNDSIAQQSVPAFAVTSIQFLICWSIALTAIVMDAVALWWRTPALAGIPLFVVVAVPSFVRSELSDGFFFILTAAVYLLIVRNRTRRVQPGVAVAVGAVAVVGALLVPVILPPVNPAVAGGSGLGALSESINPIINLGQNLRDSRAIPALSYTTTSDFGQYLRLTTLENFEGQQWEPQISKDDSANTVKKIGAPPGLAAGIATTTVRTRVQIANTTSSWLPTPYPSTKITGLQGPWYWQAGTLAVRSDTASMEGQKYTVDSLEVDPSVSQLRAAPPSPKSALAKVPAGLDPIIAATAKKVVGNAKTDFDKAIALQNWFRGGTFTYSTKTPAARGFDGSGLDVIVPFLKNKSGYCVHFATTMAVMARTLGIPSRIAVGFLPGKATHTAGAGAGVNLYEVSSSDLHAWPELYFKGIGWVRFEPTPGKGFEPSFSATTSGSPKTDPGAPANLPAPSSATPVPTTGPRLTVGQQQGQQSAVATPDTSAANWTWLFVLLLLAVLVFPGLARRSQRRRRIDRIRQSFYPEVGAWEELRDTARDLGLDARESSTPAQLAVYLSDFLLTTSGRRSADARAALDKLRRMVESESYDIPQFNYNGEQIAVALKTVSRGLRSASPLPNRIRAVLLPPTLVDLALGRSLLRA